MKLSYNVTGEKRKSLVGAISQELNTPINYLGAPTFAYEVGSYRIDKAGTVTGPDSLDLEADLQGIHGFEAIGREYDEPDIYESGLGGMGATPSLKDMDDEATAWAEREIRRLNLENQNVPDNSNRGQYGGDDISTYMGLNMTEEEELGLGRTRRENPQGENGMQASDVPESYTYQAELSDPDYPDRMEVFTATSDEDAIRQAWDFCIGEIILLELKLLDDDYNMVRGVEITPARLVLQMPLTGFTPEKLDNLCKLVMAKAPLLKAALGADDLPIQQNTKTLDFPWFRFTDDGETVKAYSTLVSLICKAAIEKKRVTAKEKNLDGSPKYAMRCFLLSLGFIGDEYKKARKILLSRLSGDSSWKNGKKTAGRSADAELLAHASGEVAGDEVSE